MVCNNNYLLNRCIQIRGQRTRHMGVYVRFLVRIGIDPHQSIQHSWRNRIHSYQDLVAVVCRPLILTYDPYICVISIYLMRYEAQDIAPPHNWNSKLTLKWKSPGYRLIELGLCVCKYCNALELERDKWRERNSRSRSLQIVSEFNPTTTSKPKRPTTISND